MTDCYCCTCQYDALYDHLTVVDPDCRNHGFDGQRPCETHHCSGKPGLANVMPLSVEAYRKLQNSPDGRETI